jgi:glycosyltransferase involved in cell wall biosynthesis
MNLAVFINALGLGGTEKAACLWAALLKQQLPDWNIQVLSLQDGPRRADLERSGIPLVVCPTNLKSDKSDFLASHLQSADVIHAHCPGTPHQGDILGQALTTLGRSIPVVQTNIFGRLDNPAENAWTDFRLFISWTSCVQAARRARRKLNLDFFRRQSVAVYPVLDPFGIMTDDRLQMTNREGWMTEQKSDLLARAVAFREQLAIPKDAVVFGRFSRPEPNKWSPIVLDAFLAAHRDNPNIRLLLREPPPAVAEGLISSHLAAWLHLPNQEPGTKNQELKLPIILLKATANAEELMTSQLACDAILHTSSFGESFGYGIAEPMALGKPVITNSTPWRDQAQIELVQHGTCGLIASTVPSMKEVIIRMAQSSEWRTMCGAKARRHILALADPEASTDRVANALRCAMKSEDNPLAEHDLEKALKTAEYLDKHQWGHSYAEQLHLRAFTAKVHAIRAFHFLNERTRRMPPTH